METNQGSAAFTFLQRIIFPFLFLFLRANLFYTEEQIVVIPFTYRQLHTVAIKVALLCHSREESLHQCCFKREAVQKAIEELCSNISEGDDKAKVREKRGLIRKCSLQKPWKPTNV